MLFGLEKSLFAEIFVAHDMNEAQEFITILKGRKENFTSYIRDKNHLGIELRRFNKMKFLDFLTFGTLFLISIIPILIDILNLFLDNQTSFGLNFFFLSLVTDLLLLSVFIYTFRYLIKKEIPHFEPGTNTRTIRLLENIRTNNETIVELGVLCYITTKGLIGKKKDIKLINDVKTEFINHKYFNYHWWNLSEILEDPEWKRILNSLKNKQARLLECTIRVGFRIAKLDTTWDLRDIFNSFEVNILKEKIKVVIITWLISGIFFWFLIQILRPNWIDGIYPVFLFLIGQNLRLIEFFQWITAVLNMFSIIVALYILAVSYRIIKDLIYDLQAYRALRSNFIDIESFRIAKMFQESEKKGSDQVIPLRILTSQNNLLRIERAPQHYLGIYTEIIALAPILLSILSFLVSIF